MTAFSSWAYAINIRVYDPKTKEVKKFTTQEDFKIPVETETQKCFLSKAGKDFPWGYNCTSRIKTGEYVPGYRTDIDCTSLNRMISTYIMDIQKDGKGINSTTRYSVIISCDDIPEPSNK